MGNQVGKQNQGKFEGMYIVVPRSNETYKEMFAKSGNRSIPFGTPVDLTEQDIKQLENQKEAVKGSKGAANPYELAKQKGISIDQAVEMMDKLGGAATTDIQWLPKYSIQKA